MFDREKKLIIIFGGYIFLCLPLLIIQKKTSNIPRTSKDHQHLLLHGLHRLEKYLNIEGFLEKSLKIKSALKSTGKSLKDCEKSPKFYYFL